MVSAYKGQVLRKIQIVVLRNIKWLVRVLPRGVVSLLTESLFSVAFLFLKRLKAICLKNLCMVYGNSKDQQEYKRMIKECIKNIGRTMIDLLYFVERPQVLSKNTFIHNEDYLKQTLKLGRGVIAVSAHLGNFPLMFVFLSRKGYKINVIIRPMRDSSFSVFMYELCAKWNINMIQTLPKKKFIKEAFSVLRRNEILFILSDEVAPKGEGVLVDFFKHKVSRAIGPMLFHNHIGSPIVPIFVAKDKKKIFHIFVEKELKVEKALSEDENNIKNTSDLTRILEGFVQKFPTQWGGWLNKKWCT